MQERAEKVPLSPRHFYERKHAEEDTRYFELYVPAVINRWFAEGDILDLGSGKQTRNIALDKKRVVFTDLSLSAMQFVKQTSPEAQCVVLDATALPFKDGAFSSILCKDILEHVPDDTKVVKEVYRCLKPGGVAGTWVPATLEADEAIHWGHLRAYSFDDLRKLFQGFRPAHIAANRIWKKRERYTRFKDKIWKHLLSLFDLLHWERSSGYKTLYSQFHCSPREYCLYLY